MLGTRVTPKVPPVEQGFLIIPEFILDCCGNGGSCCSIFSFQCNVSWIIDSPFLLWSLYCLSFLDLRLLIAHLVSSNIYCRSLIVLLSFLMLAIVMLVHRFTLLITPVCNLHLFNLPVFGGFLYGIVLISWFICSIVITV